MFTDFGRGRHFQSLEEVDILTHFGKGRHFHRFWKK